MNRGSREFILAEVVGPAAMGDQLPPSSLLMMGPQWNSTAPSRQFGTGFPSSMYFRARMCTSSLPETTGPLRATTSPSFMARTSASENGHLTALTASPPASRRRRNR